jgi:death-on-curing protein
VTRYISLAEYLCLAEQFTGVDADVLSKGGRIDLADSAFHAPQANFGGEDFSPDLIDKAAILIGRLAWNYRLVDGNQACQLGEPGVVSRSQRRGVGSGSTCRRRR